MKDINQLQTEYAELLVKSGVNIQPGQKLFIRCPVEGAQVARLCAKAAYEAGCSEVIMEWNDDEITRLKYLNAADEVFDSVHQWRADMYNTLAEPNTAWLAIYAEDPENLKGVNPDRITRSEINWGKAIEPGRERMMRNELPWCVGSIPTAAWAKAVFPDKDEEDAIACLWAEIFKACRVGGDAIADWKTHSDEVAEHVTKLNELKFKTLKYKNSAGTDVTVELPEGHFWAGGEEKTAGGMTFSANIPTEEVFTLPKRDSINGTIVATKPLCHNGTVIEGIRFEVKDGKIIEAHADTGEDVLKDAIKVDEGASYFGEVALVPYDSPISNSDVLFLNTLFDENASCHFAFGEAYPLIEGADKMTKEELQACGVNFSMTHVDFMVGSADLEIIGTTHDGREIPVFKNGNFAL